ncbi:MAG TPA: hypothetical protein PL004_12965 [Bacillota bacterium]|nr:hypothetical protein [Bacillota bacterium]
MNHILRITFFSLLFGLALMMTLFIRTPDFHIVPAETFEEFYITPPSKTSDPILPDHSINPGSTNGIITKGGRLIGGTSDHHWIETPKIIPYLHSKQVYRTFSKTDFLGQFQAAIKQRPRANPQLTFEKAPSPEDLNNFAFAISGGWDPFPRKPQYIKENHERYYPMVEKALAQLHLQAPVSIGEIIQVDLSGDGTDELLIIAEYPTKDSDWVNQKTLLEQAYSLILLYPAHNQLETAMILIGSLQEPTRYDILAVADFNGDWSMECLIRETVYTPTSQKAHRDILFTLENKKPQKVLEHRWQR